MVWARCRRGAPRGRTRAGRGAGTVGAASGARGDRARVPRPGPDGHAASDPRRLGRTGRASGSEAAMARPRDAPRAPRPGPASSRATRPVRHRTGSRPRSGLANSARSRAVRTIGPVCVARRLPPSPSGLLPPSCRSPLRSPPSLSLRLSLRFRRSAPSRDPRPRGSRQRSTTSPVRRSSARSTRRSSSGVPSLRTTVTSMRVGRSMR